MRSKVRGPLAVLLGVAAIAAPVGSAGAAGCPNEALRTGLSAGLPDCRAFELVSPTNKNGFDIERERIRAAETGAGVAFAARGAVAETASTPILGTYLARRGSGAAPWNVRGVSPAIEPVAYLNLIPFLDWSPDLSRSVIRGIPNSPLSSDANPSGTDFYVRDDATGTYSLVSQGLFPFQFPEYGGASADFGHVVYGDAFPQTANAPVGTDEPISSLYEESGGIRSLVSIGTDDMPIPSGGFLGSGQFADTVNAVSDDGSRIFFGAQGEGGNQVYVRVGGASTVEASKSQRTPADPAGPGPATYWTATTDGSAVFFTSPAELTENADTGTADAGNDLYRFDVGTKQLTDLAPGAGVLGVVGAGDDGSYVYFVGTGQLEPGKGAAGAPNLYVWHAGSVKFIATLGPGDEADWSNSRVTLGSNLGSRVSADGTEALITTAAPQSTYDNAGHSEIYLYKAATPSWTCVSCNPSNAAATGDATLAPPAEPGNPVPPGVYLNRALGDLDTVFFSDSEKLTAGDTNDVVDAYEWRQGQLSLISSGTGEDPTYFVDADAAGENAYLATRARLVAADHDDLMDVYDVRVGGEFPAAHPGSAVRSRGLPRLRHPARHRVGPEQLHPHRRRQPEAGPPCPSPQTSPKAPQTAPLRPCETDQPWLSER